MNNSKFHDCLARRGIQWSHEDDSVSEEPNIKVASRKQNSPVLPPPPRNALAGSASGSSRMTVKDLKVIHAKIQSKIVKAGISRSPPKLGELLMALEDLPGFDLCDHPFEHLPQDFFLNLSAADLDQCAWKFINPDTATAAISAMSINRNTMSTNSSQAKLSSSADEKESGAFVTAEVATRRDVSDVPPPYKQPEGQEPAGLSQLKPAMCGQVLDPRVNTFTPDGVYRQPNLVPMPSQVHQSSNGMAQPPPIEHHKQSDARRVRNTLSFREVPQHAAIKSSTVGPGGQLAGVPHQPHGYHPPGSQNVIESPNYERWLTYLSPPQEFIPPQSGMLPYGAVNPNFPSSFTPSRPINGPSTMQMAYPAPPNTLSSLIPFKPSCSRQGIDPLMSPDTLRRIIDHNFSINPNYKGGIDYHAIQNANCPSWLNCSVHVEGFSPLESQREMLSIAQHARVAALNKHDPLPPRFHTAAGDFTFFDRPSALYFVQLGLLGMVSAHGYPLSFKWNMNKVYPASYAECQQSRTLLIEGPEKSISWDKVMSVLQDNLTFDLVDGEEQYVGNSRTLLRLEFSQIRGQSRLAMKCIWAFIHTNWLLDATVDYAF